MLPGHCDRPLHTITLALAIAALVALFLGGCATLKAQCESLGVCATTSIGKSLQAADIQKKLVERAAVEFIKLHLLGRVPEPDYVKGRAIYTQWAGAQRALSSSLALWKVSNTPANERVLESNLSALRDITDSYLVLLGQYVDLGALQAKVGKEG